MKVTTAVREFSFMGVKLPDPNASLPPEEVKAAYATQYPELATASINGPEAVGDKLKYEFVRPSGQRADVMRKPKGSSTLTREAVLAELAQLAEGRHPNCQTVTVRFMRSDEWKEASKILREAIQAESYRSTGSVISTPPVWLLPI